MQIRQWLSSIGLVLAVALGVFSGAGLTLLSGAIPAVASTGTGTATDLPT